MVMIKQHRRMTMYERAYIHTAFQCIKLCSLLLSGLNVGAIIKYNRLNRTALLFQTTQRLVTSYTVRRSQYDRLRQQHLSFLYQLCEQFCFWTLASTTPGMPGTHPQYFDWGISMGISPNRLYVFSDSRPIPVVLAQWQHLMTSFIHCFAWKSKSCHRIDPNPSEGVQDKERLEI